jgi:ribosome maturation factor RimP
VTEDKEVELAVESLLAQSGLHLLEFAISHHRGNIKVKAVVYSPSGTGTDECVKAHRLILPQLQLSMDSPEPEIEISSPGIDRVIKSEREWKAFVGKSIRILPKDSEEWIVGKLVSFQEGNIGFRNRDGLVQLNIASVAKARLDSSHKGE